MVLQQFGGVNGIAFYASSIFISAGMIYTFSVQMNFSKETEVKVLYTIAGFSGSVGTIAMVAVQVLDFFFIPQLWFDSSCSS